MEMIIEHIWKKSVVSREKILDRQNMYNNVWFYLSYYLPERGKKRDVVKGMTAYSYYNTGTNLSFGCAITLNVTTDWMKNPTNFHLNRKLQSLGKLL